MPGSAGNLAAPGCRHAPCPPAAIFVTLSRSTATAAQGVRMNAAISRFPVPDLNTLPEDVRARMLGVQEKAGFIPNVFLMLAHRPAEFRAFFDYHDALMEKDIGLTKAEREMIVVATSAAADCLYCVIAHGAVLRIRARNPRVADQLATNYRKAEITPRQRVMLDFALKLSTRGGEVEEADLDRLREHGFFTANERAIRLGLYPTCSMISFTRRMFSSDTRPRL
jgi:uncharacterized peroxidase-related enzyme